MKILFVDDEQLVLDGIKRQMRRISEWECQFCDSGKEALRILENDTFDVIVSDMRMPEMSGAELLSSVAVWHPSLVRIALSGYAELKLTLRTAPVAHHYLLKPCKTEMIRQTIERAMNITHLVDSAALEDFFDDLDEIPATPLIHASLTKLLCDPDAKPADVVKLIDSRPALKQKTLALANSIITGHLHRSDDILQAIFRLGYPMLRNLVFSVEVFEYWPQKLTASESDVETLRLHSVATAQMAAKFFSDDTISNDAFIAGMLHDVGKLLILLYLPDAHREIQRLCQTEGTSPTDAELKILGVDHAMIGAKLLAKWEQPYNIIESVWYHHSPWVRPFANPELDLLSAVYLADNFQRMDEVSMAYVKNIGLEDEYELWRHEVMTAPW